MRPIFMVLYAQTCDFCDQISLYIQMHKQYFQMLCGAVQEVCLKIYFYLPCFIIGAEFLTSCEGKKYTVFWGFAICKSLLTSYFLLGLFTIF